MRTKLFEVPVDSIVEFAEILEENELEGKIIGTDDETEVKVTVDYEREKREVILDLMELIDGSDDEEDDN